MISLNIETLVLVAVWNSPFVFQGGFNIANAQDNSKKLLFFRCECHLENKMDLLDVDFSSHDYTFTHLQSDQSAICLENNNDELEQALYLLKYALKETLKKMIINPKQHLIQIDTVAMSSIFQQIKDHIDCHGQKNIDYDDIGFAVSIDFTPTENVGRNAALTLLGINKKEGIH